MSCLLFFQFGLLKSCYKIHVHVKCCSDLRPNCAVMLLQSQFNKAITCLMLFYKDNLQSGRIP